MKQIKQIKSAKVTERTFSFRTGDSAVGQQTVANRVGSHWQSLAITGRPSIQTLTERQLERPLE